MKIANEYGASTPFLRPAEISTDIASTESVALHFLKWLDEIGLDLDSLVLMQATSPVRMAHSLSEAIKLYESESADSLLTVCKTHKFIWRNLKNPQASYDIYKRPRRQDIEPSDEIFIENGSFYITKTAIYKNLKNRLGGKIVMYEMTAEESFEIDEDYDLDINQALLERVIKYDLN
jgi:N-acylneuraminate cytidylyltransferase